MKLFNPDQYQPNALAVFRATAEQVQCVVPRARIEHVGASSIPGAISKGDVDICVIVRPGEVTDTVRTLECLGYKPKQNTLRTPQLCMLVSPASDVELALQVIEAGSEFEFFIRFRDALHADVGLVDEYNRIKRRSVGFGEQAYRDAKSAFIEDVLQRLPQ